MLVQPVKKMLAIEAADRPSAQDVKATVSFIALKSLALKVDKNYTLASTNTHNHLIVAFIEAKRFQGWLRVFEMNDREGEVCLTRQWLADIHVSTFQQMIQGLCNIRDASSEILLEAQIPRSPIFVSLRCLNQDLLNFLPQEFSPPGTQKESKYIPGASALEICRHRSPRSKTRPQVKDSSRSLISGSWLC